MPRWNTAGSGRYCPYEFGDASVDARVAALEHFGFPLNGIQNVARVDALGIQITEVAYLPPPNREAIPQRARLLLTHHDDQLGMSHQPLRGRLRPVRREIDVATTSRPNGLNGAGPSRAEESRRSDLALGVQQLAEVAPHQRRRIRAAANVPDADHQTRPRDAAPAQPGDGAPSSTSVRQALHAMSQRVEQSAVRRSVRPLPAVTLLRPLSRHAKAFPRLPRPTPHSSKGFNEPAAPAGDTPGPDTIPR